MTKRTAKISERANTLALQRQQDAEALLRETKTEIETARNKLNQINTVIRTAEERQRELSQQLRDETLNLHLLKEDINYLQYESESLLSYFNDANSNPTRNDTNTSFGAICGEGTNNEGKLRTTEDERIHRDEEQGRKTHPRKGKEILGRQIQKESKRGPEKECLQTDAVDTNTKGSGRRQASQKKSRGRGR